MIVLVLCAHNSSWTLGRRDATLTRIHWNVKFEDFCDLAYLPEQIEQYDKDSGSAQPSSSKELFLVEE